MAQEIFKSPLTQAKALNPSLRDRWNKYIKYGIGSGTNVDKWNKEIEEIESQLPFADQKEHDRWLDLGVAWKGEPEWLDLTDELLKRAETKL